MRDTCKYSTLTPLAHHVYTNILSLMFARCIHKLCCITGVKLDDFYTLDYSFKTKLFVNSFHSIPIQRGRDT